MVRLPYNTAETEWYVWAGFMHDTQNKSSSTVFRTGPSSKFLKCIISVALLINDPGQERKMRQYS